MKTYEVTITKKWVETQLDFVFTNSHNEAAKMQQEKSKRVYNDRFIEIEKTGEYYRITEFGKGGKSFIFEITS